ncbi:MAG TPA: molybdopterin-binding protein [Myxococcaceae bacterium]|nr:molybdopterin-binding protein [Myxococcaceae bacterium]
MGRTGAAAIVIGNEVLSAKVEDVNGPHLVRRLREHGIPLRAILVVPDEIDAIVGAVVNARAAARWVITSGGIGPTHDDVTVRGVALALGREVIRLPRMLELLAAHHEGALPAEALRLAEAPAGTELLAPEGTLYPVLAVEGMYLLPGVPSLFRMQLETVLSSLPRAPVHLRSLYLSQGEAEIAATLDRVALGMPDVGIGSYPAVTSGADHRVRVTVEAAEAERVEQVVARLRDELPAGAVLRVE